MNAAQARAVRATFTHVSELLDGVLKLAREDLNPFDRERPDLTPAEARRLAALAAAIRRRMLEGLELLEIPAPEPEGSARWSVQTALLFSQIALTELSGADLRKYGALADEEGRLVSAVGGDLLRLVERAREVLRGEDAGSVEAHLARVGGSLGEALSLVWGFARRHELLEVYADIAAVAERAAAPAADIGVFGRTNAGKSSLINALVGQDVLPVGALPTTAVPLRLAAGPGVLRVRKASGSEEEIPLEALGRFSLEAVGLEEADVVAMDAFVPTVPPGLRFVDTPGVGSYFTPVAARAFDWLGRCDVGLLLVPAGSELEPEDAALARGLVAAGVELKVVLSKADLLAPAELERATTQIRSELARRAGVRVGEILHVSASGFGGPGPDMLRRTWVEPLAAASTAAREARLRRRVQHLIALVEAAFAGRAPGTLKAAAERRGALHHARQAIEKALDTLRDAGPAAVAEGARALAAAWKEGDPDPRPRVESSLTAPAEAALRAVRGILDEVARTTSGSPLPGDPPLIPPLFDLAASVSLPPLQGAGAGKRLVPGARTARHLAPVTAPLGAAFRRYAERLSAWSSAVLAALGEELGARSGEPTTVEVEALRQAAAALGGEADESTAAS